MLVFVIDDLAAVAGGPLLSAERIIEATGFGRPSSQSVLLLFLKRMIESKVIIRSRGLRDGSAWLVFGTSENRSRTGRFVLELSRTSYCRSSSEPLIESRTFQVNQA